MMDVKELPKVPKESEVLYLGWMKVGKVQGLQKMKGHKVVAVCGSGTGRTAEPSEEEVRKRNDLETTPFFIFVADADHFVSSREWIRSCSRCS